MGESQGKFKLINDIPSLTGFSTKAQDFYKHQGDEIPLFVFFRFVLFHQILGTKERTVQKKKETLLTIVKAR